MNSFTLKIIAMLFMALDHIYTYIPGQPIWFGYLGKLAAPIFFYLIVEGFFYTRSRKKYMIRLFTFGIVMFGIDYLLGIHNNIFLSLGLGVAMLTAIDYGRKTKKYWFSILVGIPLAFAMIFTEAFIYGLGMMLIFYFLREKKALKFIMYIVFSLVLLLTMDFSQVSSIYEQLFIFDYQWMMVIATPLLLLYNGEKGISNKFTKWMFYYFYPAHLIMIVVIGKFLF